MTQNPYAQFGPGGDFLEPMDRRTSVLAIVALVMALLCFVPGFGAIALIVGGAAIFFISRSNGRLGGLGLAITGCVIGLLTSVLWIAVIGGAMSVAGAANQHFFGPVNTMLTGVAKQDFPAARSMLSPRASAAISDEQITKFSKKLQEELGAFKGSPDSPWQAIKSYPKVGPMMEKFQGSNDIIPFPATFEKGLALVALRVDQRAGKITPTRQGSESVPLLNVGVITSDGKEIWLIEQDELDKLLRSKAADAAGSDAADEPKDGAPKAPKAPNAPDAPKQP